MTRQEAKEILLQGIRNDLIANMKSIHSVCMISPKKGKSSWTYAEMIDAITNDTTLEDSDYNPIDSYLHYLEYKNKKK